LISASIYSQDKVDSITSKSKFISYNGSLGLNTEFTSNSKDKELEKIRNQYTSPVNFRVNALLNISIYDQIQLPFEFWFTTSQVGFQQPFNQFGVNPKIGEWLTLHAGYFFSNYSDFTFGDSRVLGGGFDLNLSSFKFSGLYGRLREFKDSDSSSNTLGNYQRLVYAVKVGFASGNDLFINLNIAHAWDDTTKKVISTNFILPKDNLVSSLAFGLPISSFAKFSCEGAISIFSNDSYADKYMSSEMPSFVENIFIPRYSTQIDGSAKASLLLTPFRNYSFKFNAKWIGPGFQTLGYPNMLNDVLDLTFAPNLRFFNGDLSIKGSIGYRANNLRDNHVSNTTRVIGSLDIYSQISKNFTLNAQYSNYGMKTAFAKDTIHLQNIAEMYQINPVWNFDAFGANNNVVLSYSYQDVSDRSSYDTLQKIYITNNFNLNYSLIYESSLTLTTGLYLNSNKSDFASDIYSFTQSAGYAFLEKKLNVNATIGLTAIKFKETDLQMSLRLNANYSIDKFGTISINLSNMNYQTSNTPNYYQSPESYNELMGSLNYAITF
jgi:hypothetical protein